MALCGIVKSRFLRLWTRAPRTRISSTSPGMGGAVFVGSDWAVAAFSVGSVVMCVNKKLYAHASSGANGPKRRGDGQSPSEGRTGQPSVPIASHAPRLPGTLLPRQPPAPARKLYQGPRRSRSFGPTRPQEALELARQAARHSPKT